MAGGPGLASPFFFCAAFLLLLLVTLSVPIIKSIFLFDIIADDSVGAFDVTVTVKETVKFGIFGWCSSALTATVLTYNFDEPAQCSNVHLGFTVSPLLQEALSAINEATLVDVIQKALSVVLILHPVACAVTFLALLFSLLAILLTSTRFWDIFSTVVGFLSATLTTIIFAIDIVFVLVAKSKLREHTDGLASVGWGNAVWLTLAAAICTWVASVGACWGAIRGRKQRTTRF